MTERKTPAKKAAASQPKQDGEQPKIEREVTAGTAEPDPHAGGQSEVSPPLGEPERAPHHVNPSLALVAEHQSIGADADYVRDDTVEPDFDQAERERELAADRAYLDSRTRNLP